MRTLIRSAGVRWAVVLGIIVWTADRPLPAAAPAHADAVKAPAEGEPPPEGAPLKFKADLAFWSGVTFLVFLTVLTKFAWKPLLAALNQREAQIRDDISQAEAARQKAEEMLAEHARKLAKVQDEVREIIAEARSDAEHLKQDIVSSAQKEAEASKQRAISEIGRARDAALKDLFEVVAGEVAHATEHVLGRRLDGADQDRLIEEALAQFPHR